MKRRAFLQTGLAMGAGLMSGVLPRAAFPVPFSRDEHGVRSYQPGDIISKDVFVLDSDLQRYPLLDLVRERDSARVIVLYLFGGGSMRKQKMGGIWCRDSFEDLQIPRYLHLKYNNELVKLLPVAVAPVYSTQYYGLPERVFLDEPDDSELFRESAMEFIDSTEQAAFDGFIPMEPYFDVRNRLLFNRREDLAPGEGYGPVYPWQGKFRAEGERQKYGVPTIWLLNGEGEVLEPPFHGNLYHSDPYDIAYTILDIDAVIMKHLD